MKKPSQIAIDGPAASGKTTVGKLLADRLGFLFFDTGVMYRLATLHALKKLGQVDDEAAVTALTREMDISLRTNEQTGETEALLFGQLVNGQLHSPEVDKQVSVVAAYSGVRAALTEQQRRIGLLGDVVMVGRDIGTVVMPDAALKFFLLASPEERARRRSQENQAKGIDSDYVEILRDILRRDELDSTRTIAPLRPAEDAILIDTDQKAPEAVVAEMFSHITQALTA